MLESDQPTMSSPNKHTFLPNSDINDLIIKDSSYHPPSYDTLNQQYQDLGQNDYTTAKRSNGNLPIEPLNRLPTLYEILIGKCKAPVDLWSFYVFVRDYQGVVDYLDFWIDVMTHIRLCKDYVKGLRESLLLTEKHNKEQLHQQEIQQQHDEKYNKGSDDYRDYQSDNSGNDKSGNADFDNKPPNAHKVRESVSSSLLLEALLNDGFLDDRDNKRVSNFLQGNEYLNISDSRLTALLGPPPDQEDPDYPDQYRSQDPYEPLIPPKKAAETHNRGGPSNQFDQHMDSQSSGGTGPGLGSGSGAGGSGSGSGSGQSYHNQPTRNSTRVIPEQLERYISKVKSGNITRAELKQSSKSILNTYFQENSAKKLALPDRIVRKIRHDVEFQGRDDPDVFEDAKNHVYSMMERDSLPFFLQTNALHNVGNNSAIFRLVIGFFAIFAGLWISYTLIFIDVKPKSIRAVIIAPYLIGSYFLMTFLFRLDPVMVLCGYSDNFELSPMYKRKPRKIVKNLEEPFVKDLLKRRAYWVLFLIILVTTVLSCVFGLVPGHRI